MTNKTQPITMTIRMAVIAQPELNGKELIALLTKRGVMAKDATILTIRADVLATLRAIEAVKARESVSKLIDAQVVANIAKEATHQAKRQRTSRRANLKASMAATA